MSPYSINQINLYPMSYLKKLIEKATDTNLNLENNMIGNYKITPQHGNDLAVYMNCNVIPV